jgi:hypothetical protein
MVTEGLITLESAGLEVCRPALSLAHAAEPRTKSRALVRQCSRSAGSCCASSSRHSPRLLRRRGPRRPEPNHHQRPARPRTANAGSLRENRRRR